MEASLVVMAAGIGSRFGKGIKQLAPVGPGGDIIMDYSIYDAHRAGFRKVIFITRRDLEQEIRDIIGDRISDSMDVEYAFQELSDIPAGFSVPEERKKPWGTGQAVLTVKNMVKDPFLVINADDYYGRNCFQNMYDYLTGEMDPAADCLDMCMSGFILKNTLSENGTVTRGVCDVAPDMTLTDVTETYGIRRTNGKMEAQDEKGAPAEVSAEQYVSMNMWGLPPAFLKELEKGFPEFLKDGGAENIKSEYLLPKAIDACIKSGRGRVKVIPTTDRWFGLTYHEDLPGVKETIRSLTDAGVYPEKLYG